MKKCTKCNIKKSHSSFNKCKKHSDGYRYECRDCQRKNTKEYRKCDKVKKQRAQKQSQWYNVNKEKANNSRLKYVYGITLDDYNNLFIEQDGKCDICKIHQQHLRKKLCVDHCHETGKIRGLLCDKCNRVLGVIKDDPRMCDALKEYLIKSSDNTNDN